MVRRGKNFMHVEGKTMVSRVGKFKRVSEPKRIGKFVRAAVTQRHGR
jgi:hypothetical protein